MERSNLEELKENFTLPFEPHDYQEEAFEELLIRECSLLRFKVGLGKTVTSMLAALRFSLEDDGIEQIWIVCPPILLDQWYAFLQQIKGIPEVCLFRGTPAEKKEMDLDVSVVLVSYNIFRAKQYYPKFKKLAKQNKVCIIADELSLKNLKGKTYRKLKEILYRKQRLKKEDQPYHKMIALNATPLSDLDHVYNWCSLFAPGVYGSKRLFRFTHAVKEDHWGNVEEWQAEDVMQMNMNLFSVDTDKEVKLPPLIESVVPYTLSKEHLKLYNEVKESELANLPEDKIELALNSMFSTLQRLVLVPREFGLDIDPPILEYILGYIDQMSEDDGLLVYTRHRLVSKLLAEKIPDSAAIYGGVSKTVREEAFADLQSGKLNKLIGNIDSLGLGLNLQMLNHIIKVEIPFRDDKRTQGIGRVHRQGQEKTCFVNYTIANDTLQEKIFNNLIENGESLDKVLKTKDQVREFLY